MFKTRPAGKMPDKPLSVSPLRAELRRRITGSPDERIRDFCRQKLAEISGQKKKKDPEPFLSPG